MRVYANPAACPVCGLVATGSPRCARCGAHLLGPEARRLLSVLTEADTVLASLRLEADQWRGSWGGQAAVPSPARPTRGVLRSDGSAAAVPDGRRTTAVVPDGRRATAVVPKGRSAGSDPAGSSLDGRIAPARARRAVPGRGRLRLRQCVLGLARAFRSDLGPARG
ncbi:MAG: hypothetical protein WKF83_04230 [Nocardioidaceae bacterium]